jgi:galactose mutarotase-like enzyme
MAKSHDDNGLTTWTLEVDGQQLFVVPERGALITGWKIGSQDILYMDRDTLLDKSKSVRGGIPVLFPLAGPVRDGKYEVEGQSYALGQHGFARSSAFSVVAHGDDFIQLELLASAATLKGYPFEFKLVCTYRLANGRLWLEQEIHNHASRIMPFQFGYHPYFLTGSEKRITWEIPASSYLDNEAQRAEFPYTGQIELHKSTVDWEFLGVNRRQAGFRDEERAVSVQIGYGDEFPYLVVWSLIDKPFVCLEPWSSPRFGMNDDISITRLQPGDTAKTHVWLSAVAGNA